MKKYKIVTLGCRTNQYESQAYTDQLKKVGYREASLGEEADLCIVNTCTVTIGADRSSRHEIRALKREHPNAQLVVTGCMVESDPKALLEVDQNILVVPNQEKEKLVEYLFPDETELPEFKIEAFDSHTRAFVKVQDGCNSFCTYCIIPYVRGRSRSRPILEILEEVKGLVQKGYKEVVITGINVGDFDGGGTLADLVREVDAVEGLKALRISSIDPDEVNDDLADAVLHGKNTCPSMHIVLQSGSNVVLKRMNRKYTKQMFLETVERLVQAKPEFTITTDIIVGFPGETEGDFQETLEVVERVQFAKVHMFPFSARNRTRAALYPNRVAPDVIHKRKEALLRFSEKMAFTLREKFLGQKMSVLLENRTEGGQIYGHTANFLPVFLPHRGLSPNDLVEVELVENHPEGFRGVIV